MVSKFDFFIRRKLSNFKPARACVIKLFTVIIKGAFTLARFRTKLAHLVKKKKFVCKMCKLNAKSHAKIANVNAP